MRKEVRRAWNERVATFENEKERHKKVRERRERKKRGGERRGEVAEGLT